jgi:L-alanine-DL-glutamate epimerase-like enolase superfamily enzyme
MAACHVAAATENFLALEHHHIDDPWWEQMAAGAKPIVDRGFVTVSDGPGIGVTLNEEIARKLVRRGGYFEPTPEWNDERSWDRLWS